jgi:IS30 family transposase
MSNDKIASLETPGKYRTPYDRFRRQFDSGWPNIPVELELIRIHSETTRIRSIDGIHIGMSLDQRISDFLARSEARPALSKLEPYAEVIRTLRQRRWTYQEIAHALRDEFGVTAALSTIHAFVKVRANRKGASDHPASPLPGAAATSQPSSGRRPRFHLDA